MVCFVLVFDQSVPPGDIGTAKGKGRLEIRRGAAEQYLLSSQWQCRARQSHALHRKTPFTMMRKASGGCDM